jgi:hypothetical protein
MVLLNLFFCCMDRGCLCTLGLVVVLVGVGRLIVSKG